MSDCLGVIGERQPFSFIKIIKSKTLLIIAAALWVSFFGLTNAALAKGAWTAKAVPTQIESVRGQGFLILGAFGNNGTACTVGDSIWIAITHPQYDQLYSMTISAML